MIPLGIIAPASNAATLSSIRQKVNGVHWYSRGKCSVGIALASLIRPSACLMRRGAMVADTRLIGIVSVATTAYS
jgi:hypothetical protein